MFQIGRQCIRENYVAGEKSEHMDDNSLAVSDYTKKEAWKNYYTECRECMKEGKPA